MSRIAVVTSSPPMVEGGHMVIARSLVQALREAGHESGIIITPTNRFGRQASEYVATRLIDVESTDGNTIDQVISLRYPSYAVRHPKHVCWLTHTMREYYDLWSSHFTPTLGRRARVKEQVRRRLIHATDRYLLTRNVKRLFMLSKTVQQRYEMWPELKSTVLYPPPPQRAYRCDEYGDYIFMVSRLTPLKRASLLLEALTTPEGQGIQAVIAGQGGERERLEQMVIYLGLSPRVVIAGSLGEEELLDHLARCRAVCFPPVLEDYGFVTAEAFASGKAVVTCHDSGGPAELVRDGVNGLVCDPTPSSMAQALRRLMDDRSLAERMGAEARRTVEHMTWQDAVRQLTSI